MNLSALFDVLERLTPFVDQERAGGAPAPEHIADALWLASQLKLSGPDTAGLAPQSPEVTPGETRNEQPEARSSDGITDKPLSVVPAVPLYAQRSTGAAKALAPLRTPTAAALPHALALARALRPLRRRVPSKFRFTLDEDATAELAAVEGRWQPVLRPIPERWLDLAIVVDDGPSMRIWRSTVRELRLLLERQGIARDVRSWRLDTGTAGRVRLLAASGSRAERRAPEVADVSGRRLVLVISDCISPAWWGYAVGELVEHWTRYQPVALVQMLPQRLWAQTALGAAAVVPVRAPRAASAGCVLSPMSRRRTRVGRARSSATAPFVSVTTLEPEFVRVWARFLGARAGARGPAVGLGALRSVLPAPMPRLPPLEAVERFQARASPLAFELACVFAAAALRLPVMRLVQHSILPDSGQVHLAEFLSSGLLRRDSSREVDIEDAILDFEPGVREALLDAGTFARHLEVQRISEFIGPRFGQVLDFEAYLGNPETLASAKDDPGASPFAAVSAAVLRRLGGKYREAADQFLGVETQDPTFSNEQDSGRAEATPVDEFAFEPIVAVLPAGQRWWRFTDRRYADAFGGSPMPSRFSDPASERGASSRWRVLYLADSFSAALQEAIAGLTRSTGSQLGFVDEAALAGLDWLELRTARQLSLVDLRGLTLVRSGLPPSLFSDMAQERSRALAEACFNRPENFDGIIWSSRTGPGDRVALFEDRARDGLDVLGRSAVLSSREELGRALSELGIDLISSAPAEPEFREWSGRQVALVLGIDGTSDNVLHKLAAVKVDVERFATLFQDLGFETRVLYNQSAAVIRRALSSFRSLHAEATILYWSGHHQRGGRDLIFLASDSSMGGRVGPGILLTEIVDAVLGSSIGRTLLMFDSSMDARYFEEALDIRDSPASLHDRQSMAASAPSRGLTILTSGTRFDSITPYTDTFSSIIDEMLRRKVLRDGQPVSARDLHGELSRRFREQVTRDRSVHPHLFERDTANEFVFYPPAKPHSGRSDRRRVKANFTVVAPSDTGMNWKPDPSHVDEKEGYCFTGKFEVEASLACDVSALTLSVVRNDHYAICAAPGKESYYNGPLPGERRRFGFVLIDGEEEYVDADNQFLRLVRVKAGQKLLVSISRWCRAIGRSRDDPETDSITYWTEQPRQVVSITYTTDGNRYKEDHAFDFDDDHRMKLAQVELRGLSTEDRP